MSFGAGMGAGMGAGIGAGIAIGSASGQKKAVSQIRDYVETNGLTIHDRMGKVVPLDTILDEAGCANDCSGGGKGFVVIALIFGLLGIAALAGVYYFVLF